MRKFKKSVCLFLALVITVCAFAGCTSSNETIDLKNVTLTDEQVKDVTNTLDENLNELNFSGTVYCGINSQDILLKSYGYKDKSESTLITDGTVYQLSSVSKIFTGIAIMQLEAEGKIKLTDTLDKYLSSYGNYSYLKNITVKSLLEMTSGFGSYLSEFANSGKAYKKVCKKLRKNQFNYKVNGDITSYILSKGTPHDYGEYHYSNSGYFLLGKIIGSFSDGGYQGYITDNIITPLKLKNTNFVYAKSDTTGYNESTENWISSANSLYLNNFYILFSSMGIESTAEDLNTLIDAILNNEIADGVDCLSKIKSGDTKFNYGFYVNGNILSTQGTSDVHSSYIYIDTDRMIKSIVLSNHIGIDNFDQYGKTVYNAVNAKLNGMLIDNA